MRYKLKNYCEIDKFASQSYSAVHNEPESKNLGDITKVDIESLPSCDLITHGSPCQSFSLCGKQDGGDEGSGTRSSLMWNSVQIIAHCKPKFVVWENVANVLSTKHKHNFDKYINRLDELGYNSTHLVMTASDYGLPQSRKRIFIISVRKDIDTGLGFVFPSKESLSVTLKDLVQPYKEVGDFYDLSEKALKHIVETNFQQAKARIQKGDICATLLARDYKEPKAIEQDGVVRKLTPLEYWRIQGFRDEDFYKAQESGISNTQLYKQAGNSIAVTCVEKIFKSLKEQYPDDFVEDIEMISLFSGIGAFEAGLSKVK